MTSLRLLAVGLLAIMTASSAGTGTEPQTIRIATGNPIPAEAALPTGDLTGFEADLAVAICQRMQAKCEVIVAAGGDPVAALLEWWADAVIAGLSVSPERRRVIDFSRAYASMSHGFAVVKPGRLSDLPGAGETVSLSTNPADATAMIAALRTAFAGKTLAAAPGTPDLAFLEQHFGDVATIPDYATVSEFESDLAAGRIDALMDTITRLKALATQPVYSHLLITGPRFDEDDILGFGIAVGVRKSDHELRDLFDRAISDMISEGSLRLLSLKWFKVDITPHRCACKPF